MMLAPPADSRVFDITDFADDMAEACSEHAAVCESVALMSVAPAIAEQWAAKAARLRSAVSILTGAR